MLNFRYDTKLVTHPSLPKKKKPDEKRGTINEDIKNSGNVSGKKGWFP